MGDCRKGESYKKYFNRESKDPIPRSTQFTKKKALDIKNELKQVIIIKLIIRRS